MQKRGETYILQCPACGSRTFEIHGPTTESEVVFCAECGAEVGELDEVMAVIESRVQDQERRKRQIH